MIEALGRYELLRMLGRGGMAEVYLARRRVAGLEKRLVVKRIRRERVGDPALLDLFMREARLSMSLGHQNVVPVFDFGRVGDDAFLAMEYVDGRDLGSTLAQAARPVPPLLAAYIAAECCRALDHAHHRRAPDGTPAGVIHRDVTPRNVLLSWAGEVKLTDFGVATPAGDGDHSVRGTWAYMAPEQARGEAIDGRADLYALGLVLWSMLAGARPRPGDDGPALRALATSGSLPLPPPGPPALAAVLARATSASAAARFTDAHEMQEALDAWLIAARAETPGPPPERLLAAWLADVWGDEARRSDPGIEVPGEVLTIDRTQRSNAATVGDAPAAGAGPGANRAGPPASGFGPLAPGEGPQASGLGPQPGSSSPPPSASPPPSLSSSPSPSPTPEPSPSARRRWIVSLTVTGIAAAAIALAVARPWHSSHREPVAPLAAVSPPPTTSPPSHIDSPPITPSPPPPPTLQAESPHATAPLRAGRKPPRLDVPSPSTSPPLAPPPLRHVTIGATPWADFTVDDDPAPHQTPETLTLPAGPHRIHLRNPTIGLERTITVDVPTDRDLRHVEHLDSPPVPSR